MGTDRLLGACFGLAAVVMAAFTAAALAGESAVAPGKFIPTFAVKYGSTSGWPPVEQAARFDLLVVSSSIGHARVYASQHGNSWQTLKVLNPHIRIFLYKNGPGLYNTASWGELGQGWKWLVRNHGPGSTDRWTAMGVRYGGCLQGEPYPNERLMNLGNPHWQHYWAEQTYKKYWTGREPAGRGADGIFADNCGYQMPWRGRWHLEGNPDKADMPIDYTSSGVHQPELYKTHIQAFHNWVVPWLDERGLQLAMNFGQMARQPENWLELDSQPHPVFAAMEEGAFVHPWGTLGRKGNFVFWSETEWLNQVDTMRKLKHVRALMNVHGPVVSEADDARRMDARDASGNRAWDVLWYALASFLQGYDPVRQNAYMNFTVWGYSRFYWFDEFDPRYLHLGKALGPMQKVTGTTGHVYLRPFEDGWVAVNPTRSNAAGIPVPQGHARIIGHDNLKQAESAPLVDSFDLASHRGVVLLKPGHRIGNADNH